jgi:hypothetical protein
MSWVPLRTLTRTIDPRKFTFTTSAVRRLALSPPLPSAMASGRSATDISLPAPAKNAFPARIFWPSSVIVPFAASTAFTLRIVRVPTKDATNRVRGWL